MRNSILCLVFLLILQHAKSQLKHSTNTLLASSEISRATSHKAASPLGDKAFELYRTSYIEPCIDAEGNVLEAGIWIEEDAKKFQYLNRKLIHNGVVMEKFNSKNLARIHGYLVKLERKSDYARNMIKALQSSDNRFNIKISTCDNSYMVLPLDQGRKGILNNNAYAFQIMETEELIVDYAPYNRIGSSAEIRWTPKDKLIKVAHELGHAYDANFGLMDDRLISVDGQAMLRREIRAIYHENNIRRELKMGLRKSVHDVQMMILDGDPITYPLPYIARH